MTKLEIPSWWKELEAKPTPKNIVKRLGFLCESDACKTILEQIALLVTDVKVRQNKYQKDLELALTMSCMRDSKMKTEELVFKAPRAAGLRVPPSFAAILKVAGSISMDLYGLGFWLSDCNDQEWEDWEDWFEEYAPEFLGTEIVPVISRDSDQFVYHPTWKRSNGEAQIVWLSHDGGGIEAIAQPELGAGGVFLRLMQERFFLKDDSQRKWFL